MPLKGFLSFGRLTAFLLLICSLSIDHTLVKMSVSVTHQF